MSYSIFYHKLHGRYLFLLRSVFTKNFYSKRRYRFNFNLVLTISTIDKQYSCFYQCTALSIDIVLQCTVPLLKMTIQKADIDFLELESLVYKINYRYILYQLLSINCSVERYHSLISSVITIDFNLKGRYRFCTSIIYSISYR